MELNATHPQTRVVACRAMAAPEEEKKHAKRLRLDVPIGIERPNAFVQWMVRHRLEVETVASMLKVTISAVYGYRRGDRPPGRKVAVRIEGLTDGEVPVRSWG